MEKQLLISTKKSKSKDPTQEQSRQGETKSSARVSQANRHLKKGETHKKEQPNLGMESDFGTAQPKIDSCSPQVSRSRSRILRPFVLYFRLLEVSMG